MNITKVLVWKVRFFFFLCLFLCSSHLKIVARLSCWVDIFYIKWFIPGEMSERCGKWTPCCQWLGRNRMNVLLKWAEKPMSQDFSRNIFLFRSPWLLHVSLLFGVSMVTNFFLSSLPLSVSSSLHYHYL